MDIPREDLVPGNVGGPPQADGNPDEEEPKSDRDLKADALSREHLLTHIPKNVWCKACQRAKMNAKRARRKANKAERMAEIRFGMVILDHATTWLETHPACNKSADEAVVALESFQGARQNIKVMFIDNAPELVKTLALLKRHDTSTPSRSTTNAEAERTVRTVLEGTRTVLEQAGLSPQWWPHA
eukprot:10831532-Heterocapsa_arctica.AAC.1